MPAGCKNTKKNIYIKGARVHNLKNIDIQIPRNKLVVITGLSGSGKSSLAFDTLYAEGQRRYVESLSAYARQFLGRINKPDVDFIKGIPPAIAIEQKVNTRNPRSTVGTSTEIYDYLKLLYARIGKTYSPISGRRVKKHTVTDVVNYITGLGEATGVMILAPYIFSADRDIKEEMALLVKQGITRIESDGELFRLEELITGSTALIQTKKANIVIDRIKVQLDEDSVARYADSVQTAFSLGKGKCLVKVIDENNPSVCSFSDKFEADGIKFEEPDIHMFSFNNPLGACPLCGGYGKVIGIDGDLVIPNKGLSIYEDAIVCWKGEKMRKWKEKLIYHADKSGIPIHKPYYQLTSEQKQLIWKGNKYFRGLNAFFNHLENKKYKIQYRVMLSRYRGKTICPECRGTRLRKEASYVRIQKKTIQELVSMPVNELYGFIHNLNLNENEEKVAGRILAELRFRLKYLTDVGLSYLTLNRLSSTLSGGESQRINLATSLGSSLVGSLYILDEPSIGLHPRDIHLLIGVLRNLQKLGNTVLVVEHDEEIIRSADEIIDMGPLAGLQGGQVVYQGLPESLLKNNKSLTAKYLNGEKRIEVPSIRRKWNNYIRIGGARENNLKNIDVKIPLNVMTIITGVSGSGKSSLIKNILCPALNKIYNSYGERSGAYDFVNGDIHLLQDIVLVDQNPIGRSSRSNPVTYVKAYDEIRKLYADQQIARINGYKPSHFSFNIDGGRCEECQGEGVIKVEMQFMADISLVCESCKGKRFKDEILEVKYHGKNIYELLDLSVNQAIDFFNETDENLERKIVAKLKPLADVGLGYIKLGQSSSTLSGGESQRVKLASYLYKEQNHKPTLFVFDEPTTGLHFHDIKRLLDAFHALIEKGHSIVTIEHNLEIIKSADWIIDLGPEGGTQGGYIVFEGTPEELVKIKNSYTGKFLEKKIKEKPVCKQA
jgi:excinuclease ABC subunit A